MSRRLFIAPLVIALGSAAFTLSAWCVQPEFDTLKGNTAADGHNEVADGVSQGQPVKVLEGDNKIADSKSQALLEQ
jgi:hypothetical protein